MRSQRYRVRAFSYRSASRRLFHVKQFGEMCSRENRGGVCGRGQSCPRLRLGASRGTCVLLVQRLRPLRYNTRMENEQNTQPAAAPAETPMPALDIVLASASPRRKQLLEDAGVRFVVHASEVDETLEPDLLADPPEACKKLAERKAGAVVQEVLAEDYTGMAAVIGADTMVVCEGEIFGKPVSLSDAKRMLRCLSGRTHEVLTAVSVWMVAAPEPENISLGFRTFVDRSAVTFRELTDEEIVDYLRKGESFDKAGAYAVQGAGADLVARVDGAMDTVIGLPVGRLLEEFPDFAGSAS